MENKRTETTAITFLLEILERKEDSKGAKQKGVELTKKKKKLQSFAPTL